MNHELSVDQIRYYRLHSHHLDVIDPKSDPNQLAGACGMQNTPPGAWETALFNRIPDCPPAEMERLLYQEKSLIQAWSLRGAPVVFPAEESDVFLSALIPENEEPWIYTNGILLALDFLQMSFEELFRIFLSVMPQLNGRRIVSKTELDQTIAGWMLPLLPAAKQGLWNRPSMYGNPGKQTVGGAAVSFFLRPASFHGLVVFGEREGISPTFTSYQSWAGHSLKIGEGAQKQLVRKFLRCYGPATLDSFLRWLGCSRDQGRRLWETVSEEIEPVLAAGKKAYFLAADKDRLFSPDAPQRDLLLLGGHDPYLDQRDRFVLQPDPSLHKQIWKLQTNPGVVLSRGEIIGIWTGKKKGNGLEIKITLWTGHPETPRLSELAEEYAAFRRLKLTKVEIL